MASDQQSSSQSSHGDSNANDAQNPSPKSPFYIHPSETPESFKPSLVLSGSNDYSKWYRGMNVALVSKKKLAFVDGTIAVPTKDDPIYGAWKRCNDVVLSWIVKTVSHEIANSVRGMDKAVDVWTDLKKRYSPGHDRFIISGIWKDIHSLRQGEGTVTSYFTEFTLLWSQLEILDPLPACTCVTKCSCAAKGREETKAVEFLRGLDDRFAAARSRMMGADPLPSILKVFTWVVQEETQMVSGANQTTQQYQSQPPSVSSASIQPIPETQPEIEVTRIEKLLLRIHQHKLTLTPSPPEEPYTCSGCGELGFGCSYRCEICESSKCKYVLHEECAEAVDQFDARHPLFGETDIFSFLKNPLGRPRVCDACRKEVKGFVYHRPDNGRPDDTGLDVHPCCFKLKDIPYKEGNVTKALKLHRTIPKECLKCKSMTVGDERKVKGWAYVSSDRMHCYHVSCFKELIHEKLKEGYFSKEKMSVQRYDPKTQLPLKVTGKEMVKVRVSSKGSGTLKVVSQIASVVIQLVFSAIFGNPVSFVLTLVQALATIIS